MTKTLFMIFGLFFIINSNGQIEKEAYIKKVIELCPGADIVEVEIKEEYVEVEYLCNGIVHEIALGMDIELVYLESPAEIPGAVLAEIQKKLEKNYSGWKIDEYAHIQLTDTSFYKAEIIRAGVESNVYFTLNGKYYTAKNVVVNASWNIKDLERMDNYSQAPYNFLRPDRMFEMPDILTEISGIALPGESLLFCIQDEAGVVFSYSHETAEITDMMRFTDKGDFEDLTIKEDFVYALRSDGTLFFFNYKDFNGEIHQTVIPLNCLDIEGLDYDNTEGVFYIACKDPLISSHELLRHVYRVKEENMHDLELAFTIDLREVNRWIKDNYPGLRASSVSFNPSAVAVHPITKETWVLSASNRLLAVYDGSIISNIYLLPPEIYYKPEGLAITDAGDLYISSEGMKKGYGKGMVYFFEWRD